ncbi:hypothetical protein [Pacificimonas flava]|uniref:hypothetical protein n=1 Tax=Pacificimonas flava TaxID=1234595 RepID=UPI00056DB51C|nr:hypothetical protein [Pacificimonas flava]
MLIITLVIALILAWPTFGLSIVGWIIFALFSTRSQAANLASVDGRIDYLKNRYFAGENQHLLMLKLAQDEDEGDPLTVLDSSELGMLGNIFLRHLANNPDLFEQFEFIIQRYEKLKSFPTIPQYGSAVHAIDYELEQSNDVGGALAMLVYSSLLVLCQNNPHHTILSKMDKRDFQDHIGVVRMMIDNDRDMGVSLF